MSPSRIAFAFAALLAIPAPASAGRFVVLSPIVESDARRQEAREMQESGVLQDLAEALNSTLVLPRDVGMRFAECGEANAFYDADKRQILMCLELMEGMAETLQGQFEDDDSTTDALAGAYISVALHEAGHALVDVLELPVTGREEDAVDQLAAWLLIEADDVDSVLGAAASYYTEDEAGEDDYADEHSLGRQRYFNLLCWAYGSNPDESAHLIETWELPEARAERCQDEYAQLDRSWSKLLQPHLRGEDETAAATDPAPAPAPAPQSAPQRSGKFVGTVKPKPAPARGGGD
jgi:hypothetical protein